MMPPVPPPVAIVARTSAACPDLLPPDLAAEQADWIERTARWLAGQQSAIADEIADGQSSAAIAEWRLYHAALWHRVRYRARFIRAVGRDHGAANG